MIPFSPKYSVTSSPASFRRAIAPINPFALQQVTTENRLAFGERDSNGFFVNDIYPTYRVQNAFFPTHHDPLKNSTALSPSFSTFRYMLPPQVQCSGYTEEVPRACARTQSMFKRCEMVNGREKCQNEMTEVMKICPDWALDLMRRKKRKNLHISLIDSAQYRRVMEVSEYNKGRTPADISNKTYVHGTRKYLRPDTMWCDDRYADITQKDINEAKEKMAARRGKMDMSLKPQAHYDWQHIVSAKQPDDPIY